MESRKTRHELTKHALLRKAGFTAALVLFTVPAFAVVPAEQYLTGMTATADPGYAATKTTDASGHPVINLSVANITTVLGRIPTAIVVSGEGCDLSTTGTWNLSNYGNLTMSILNNNPTQPVLVRCEVSDDMLSGFLTGMAVINPGETKTLDTLLVRKPDAVPTIASLVSAANAAHGTSYPLGIFDTFMDDWPGEARAHPYGQDLAAIKHVKLHFPEPYAGLSVKVTNIKANKEAKLITDTYSVLTNDVPLFDKFGQRKSVSWLDKITSNDGLEAQDDAEAINNTVDNHSLRWNSGGWGGYGAWALGPTRTADNSFHTEKVNGLWWLVSPSGSLFWSFGLNGVADTLTTKIQWPTTSLFDLASIESSLKVAPFYAANAYIDYNLMNSKRRFDPTGANPNWWDDELALAIERLWSWHMNTVGSWSDRDLGLSTGSYPIPYTAYIQPDGTPKALDGGTWAPAILPDPWDSSYSASLTAAMTAEKNTCASHTDPMCIGYFVHNEIPFGSPANTTSEAFAAPAAAAGKTAMINLFKTTYANSIASLNAAWGTSYASWTALANVTNMPGTIPQADLLAFQNAYLTQLYLTCRNAVKTAAPNRLYLGSRLNSYADNIVTIAAQFCDVVSMNVYTPSIGNLRLPAGVDKPILISEFHFGTTGERGSLRPGLTGTRDAQMSSRMFDTYVKNALMNPNIVGVHWYSYYDNQPNSGNGFVDHTGTPYPSKVETARDIGTTIYAKRYGTLIYEDRFPGETGSLSGTAPAFGTGYWSGNTAVFNANGTVTAGATAQVCAWLPFTPVSGKIYKVSVRILDFQATGYRLGVGFLNNPTLTKTPYNSRAALSLVWADGTVNGLTYGSTSADTSPAPHTAPVSLAVILDTRASPWQVKYQMNNATWESVSYSGAASTITAVGITRDGSGVGGGAFDNFVLEVLPSLP